MWGRPVSSLLMHSQIKMPRGCFTRFKIDFFSNISLFLFKNSASRHSLENKPVMIYLSKIKLIEIKCPIKGMVTYLITTFDCKFSVLFRKISLFYYHCEINFCCF